MTPLSAMPDVPGASSQGAHVGPWTVVLTSLGVAAFAAAWHFGLWMVVAAGLSAGGTLVHGDVSHRWWLESRLAAWALHAPHGRCPPQGLEGAISPDLAAISGGDLDVIDRGQRLVEADSRDPWQRAMASERLTAAADLVRAGAVPPTRGHQRGLGFATTAATAGVAVVLVISHPTRQEWFVVFLSPALVALCIVWRNQYRRRVLRPSLIVQAVGVVPVVPMQVPEAGVGAILITLAEGDARLLQHAAVLASDSTAPSSDVDVALARLRDASLAINHRRPVSQQALVAWWAIASAALMAAARWLA